MNKTTSQMKKAFAKLLYENSNIVNLIDDKTIVYPDDLLGTHIFTRLKIDFTEQEVGSYIGLNISYPSVCSNELYKNYILTILIVSHNDHVSTRNGDSRVDLLGEEIVGLLNWNSNIGFILELKSDVERVLDMNHYSRELVFKSITSNSVNNGVKVNG